MTNEYLEVVYSEKRTPKTAYPRQLTAHLMSRFDLKAGQKILELGSGRGDFINEFQSLGMDASAVDREESPHTATSVTFKKVDLEKDVLPFPDNSFDVVYHKSVLEHFYTPNKIMGESYRVLKPGGKLVFLVPDWERVYKIFYEDVTHCRPYTLVAVRDVLHMFGFGHVHAEKFFQMPIIWRLPFLKIINNFFYLFISVTTARKLTALTGIKYFRWSIEPMILGYGEKSRSK